MKIISDLYKKSGNLHHAYCIVGEVEPIFSELQKFFEKDLKFSIHNNPDFWHGVYDTMDVEDSRILKDLHYSKPTASDRKIFVLQTNFITEKAQNAMLKFFEEPVGGTHFFVIIPSANNLIPTLKSRLMVLKHESIHDSGKIKAKIFLKSSVSKRMDMVKNLAESISDEEESKIQVINFFNSLLEELSKNLDSKNTKLLKTLEDIEKIKQYSSEQSPSLKMLMEYIALTVPLVF